MAIIFDFFISKSWPEGMNDKVVELLRFNFCIDLFSCDTRFPRNTLEGIANFELSEFKLFWNKQRKLIWAFLYRFHFEFWSRYYSYICDYIITVVPSCTISNGVRYGVIEESVLISWYRVFAAITLLVLLGRDLCLDFVFDRVRSCFSVEGMAPN